MAAAAPPFRPFPDVQLSPKEKVTARAGDDLIHAVKLSGPGAKYPDHRFTETDGPDDESPRLFGTNFVPKPVERFTLLDALHEALGTAQWEALANESNLRRKGPLDLFGNLHANAQHVVCVYLGKDPRTGKDYPRTSKSPTQILEDTLKEVAAAGGSAMELAGAGKR